MWQDAAIFSERLAELFFEQGRTRFAHAYLLEALEMWHAIGTNIKVNHIKQKYPDALEVALFKGKGSGIPQVSLSSSSLHLSTDSRSTPLSMVSSSKVPSEASGEDDDEGPKTTTLPVIVLGDLNAKRGPLTPTNTLEILGRLSLSDNLEDMLGFFMSQLLIRTGCVTYWKRVDL